MSTLDLDKLGMNSTRWNFCVKLDGVSYPTRPLKLADLTTAKDVCSKAELDAAKAFIEGLFCGSSRPNLDAIDAVISMRILLSWLEYGKGWAKRNAVGAKAISSLARQQTKKRRFN